MRKIAYTLLTLAVAACSQKEPVDTIKPSAQGRTIEVSMQEITKTAIGEASQNGVSLVWSTGDEIAVVEGKGTAEQKHSVYRLIGEGGSPSGTFEYVSGDEQ